MKITKLKSNLFYYLRVSLFVLPAVIYLSGCQKKLADGDLKASDALSSVNSLPGGDEADGIPYQQGDVVLGGKKQNPYTVTNMNLAFSALSGKGISSGKPVNIRATHLYVKFKPQNINQYEVLSSDTTLALSDYPIEAEVIQNSNRYHDPSLPSDVPTYQYTAVKSDYTFIDSILYEIIDELYIPEEDISLSGLADENAAFVEKLLDEAYIQTNNFTDTVKYNNLDPLARYVPGGRIRLFDTRLGGLIGMEGVRVQARRWFIVYYAYPDFNGNYRMNHGYRRPCNYSLWFADPLFAVREHLFG